MIGKVGSSIRVVLMTTLLFTVCLVQFNLLGFAVLACLILMALICLCAGTRLFTYGPVIMFALILGAWFDSSRTPNGFIQNAGAIPLNEHLPPVIHILLDSFIGLGGLPDYPESEIFRKEMESLLRIKMS